MHRIRNLIDSISNLIYYFKVIWNDRNWDQAYLEYLLLAKLKRIYNRYSKNDYFDKQDKIVQQLKICIECIERADSGFYWNTINYNNNNKNIIHHNCYADTRDNEIISTCYKIIEKYSAYWWD